MAKEISYSLAVDLADASELRDKILERLAEDDVGTRAALVALGFAINFLILGIKEELQLPTRKWIVDLIGNAWIDPTGKK